MPPWTLAVALLVAALVSPAPLCVHAGVPHSVVTELVSPWAETPLLLEGLELFAEHAPTQAAFWDFLTSVRAQLFAVSARNSGNKPSDQAVYNALVSVSAVHLPPLTADVFKLGLQARAAAPAVVAALQIAREQAADVLPECAKAGAPFVALSPTAATCTVFQLDKLRHSVDAPLTVFDADHVFPGANAGVAPPAILYACIDDQASGYETLHEKLVSLARAGHVTYILRHYCPSLHAAPAAAMRLAGWAAELAVKKTEYRAVDDTKPSTAAQAHGKASGEVAFEGDDRAFIDFTLNELRQATPEQKEADNAALLKYLSAHPSVIKAIPEKNLMDIGFKAATKIMQSANPLATLRHISENFPTLAAALAEGNINATISKEIITNQRILAPLGLDAGGSFLTVNSLVVDPASLNLFTLLALLRKESAAADELSALGVPANFISDILRITVPPEASGAGSIGGTVQHVLDLRSDAVVFFNNLEADTRYRRWPKQLRELLRPVAPGELRYLGKNLFTAAVVVDVATPASLALLLRVRDLVEKEFPVRFGFVLASSSSSSDSSDSGETTGARFAFTAESSFAASATPAAPYDTNGASALVRAFSALHQKKPSAAFAFLFAMAEKASAGAALTADSVKATLKATDVSIEWSALGESSQGRFEALGNAYVHARALKAQLPCVLVNTVQLPRVSATDDSLEMALRATMQENIMPLQRAVYYGELRDSDDVLKHLMTTQPGVVARVSAWTTSRARPVTLSASARVASAGLPYLASAATGPSAGAKQLSFWIAADLMTPAGQRAVFEVLRRQLKTAISRVSVLHTGAVGKSETASVPAIVAALILDASQQKLQAQASNDANSNSNSNDGGLTVVGEFLARVLSGDAPHKEALGFLPAPQQGAVLALAQSEAIADILLAQGRLVVQDLGLPAHSTALVVNMQVIGPFAAAEAIEGADLRALEKIHGSTAKALASLVKRTKVEAVSGRDVHSDIVMHAAGLLTRLARDSSSNERQRLAGNIFNSLKLESSAIHAGAAKDTSVARHTVLAILNPLSKQAQVVVPYLELLAGMPSVSVRVVLNPQTETTELPLQRFYRTVLPSLSFSEAGFLQAGPRAVFSLLPPAPLLTFGLHAPAAWMVQPVSAAHDLDNIHLESAPAGVSSVFELEYLLIEGTCSTSDTGRPVPGLEFQSQSRSGAQSGTRPFDTIVMANLGYFQLKALPGAWRLSLRPGRSATMYAIAAHDGADTHSSVLEPLVVVNDYTGRMLQLSVRQQPGTEGMKLLDEDEGAAASTKAQAAETAAEAKQQPGLFSSLSSMFGSGKDSATASAASAIDKPAAPVGDKTAILPASQRTGEVINIFSLASGHLYERFLKIMMLSVLKNTRNPVKFWFLKNCMSPTLKAFLPAFAQAYGFEYELVQYNWPAWLTAQSEKQRQIWGYKILFLDVLFPLDVKKIIFVDADQVVRTDMKELIELDLEGAVYGYTPFCNSRKEMDGFRFWNSGYWKEHLNGRPYHISALYVVDLVRFRQFAAGDRIRGQYQGLSRDPNSLSNLDQDLPNNMVHQVPIKSLPQDWLWCETWCSDASKASAKTIDLCNNPLTKEPKLQAAVRILPEWQSLDWEAGNFSAVKAESATVKHEEL